TGPEGFCGYCLNPVLCSRLGSDFLFHLAEAVCQRSYSKVCLFLIDQERWRQANGVLTRAEHQQTLMKCQIHDGVAQIPSFFLGALITDDFDANHQSAPPDVADDFEVLRPICRPPEEVVSHVAGVFLVLALDQIHSGQRGSQTHRVSAEGCTMRARLPPHY